MTELSRMRVWSVVGASFFAAAYLGAVSAQGAPTALNVCTSALESCNLDLKKARKGLGGWSWLDGKTSEDLRLLLQKAAEAGELEHSELHSSTRELMNTERTSAKLERSQATAAIQDLAGKLRARDRALPARQPAAATVKTSPTAAPVVAAPR
jgi:hypothetical protein